MGQIKNPKRHINYFAKTKYGTNTKVFGIKDKDRIANFLVSGQNDSYKNELFCNMALQDMLRSYRTVFIDNNKKKIERISSILDIFKIKYKVLDLESKNFSINIFKSKKNDPTIADKSEKLVDALTQSWDNWQAKTSEYTLRVAVNTLFNLASSENLHDLLLLLGDRDFQAKAVRELDDDFLRSFWAHEYQNMSEKDKNRMVSPIVNEISKTLSNETLRLLFNNGAELFDFEEAFENYDIVLLNLNQKGIGDSALSLVSHAILYNLYEAVLDDKTPSIYYIYINDFNKMSSGALLKFFETGPYSKLALHFASSFLSSDYKHEVLIKKVLENSSSRVFFRSNLYDAKIINDDTEDEISPSDILNLNEREAFVKIKIDAAVSNAFIAEALPLLDLDDAIRIRENFEKSNGDQVKRQYSNSKWDISNLPGALEL